MGWSSGSSVGSAVEAALEPFLDRFTPAELRQIAKPIVEQLEELDADDLEECSGFIGDEASFRRDAPQSPKEGDTYEWCGWTRRFDGRRWRFHNLNS